MRRWFRALSGVLAAVPFALAVLLAPKGEGQGAPPVAEWTKTLGPFLQKYCVSCHTGNAPPGGVRFDEVKSAAAAMANRHLFDRAAERIKAKEMPPPGSLQPPAASRSGALLAIQRIFAKAPPPPADPGRVTMRRLNRAEYDNTVRDLLGIDVAFSEDFPTDDVGYGFDNIGDVLTLSPLLFEKYLDAAENAAEKAIALPESRLVRFSASDLQTDRGNDFAGALALNSLGYGEVRFRAPKAGSYRLKVNAWAQQAGPDPARMSVRLGERELQLFDVNAVQRKPEAYELTLDLRAGPNRIAAYFVNDYYQPQAPDPKMRGDRNLFLESFEVEGPIGAVNSQPASHRRLIPFEPDPKDPAGAAKKILEPFLNRAFRRPASEAEVNRFAELVQTALKEGEPFEQGVRNAVAAALVSPHFLFRVELDASAGGRVRNLTDHELASRLSYFLWSSLPDDELLSQARQGRLKDPQMLQTQALRMLKSPKARALTQNFASQWLTLRKLEDVSPDPDLYPSFSEPLRDDMSTEVERHFEYVMREDRSVIEFLDAPYAFVNGRLAQHYGIPNVGGPAFRKVPLSRPDRGGLLTSAAVLTVTSNPNRTSPVKRGKWVLENILGEPPPPPPPGLDSLEEDKVRMPAKTIKERMARHRKDPSCAVCHQKMDPLGIAFENYDPIGKWRTRDGRFAVDAAGTTAKGEKFKNATDLKRILLKQKGQFVRTLAEKLMTYGLGRGVELSDRKALESIAAKCQADGFRFSALVKGVVASEAFRKKRV